MNYFSQVDVEDFMHPFPMRIPNMNFSYSDHEAIMATFKLSKGKIKLFD